MSISGRALWFIESHLSDSLSLETIAAAVGVSVFHLSRAFSLAVGSGPMAVADHNLDGKPDLIWGSESSGLLSLLLNITP